MYDSVIIVTGQRLEYSAIPEWGTLWYFRDPSVPPGFGYIYDYQGNHYVQGQFDNVIHIDFVPNDEQAALINRFRQAVENSRNAINGLHPDAELRLRDGLQVESYELKDLISKSSFRIDPPGTRYPGAHGQQIGQADYNGGYPVIRLSLDSLEGYGFHDGGLNTLVLHEIAHVTEAVRAFYSRVYNDADGYTAQDAAAHEQLAFDVSRAILEARSLRIWRRPPADIAISLPLGMYQGTVVGASLHPSSQGRRAGTPIEWMPRRTRFCFATADTQLASAR